MLANKSEANMKVAEYCFQKGSEGCECLYSVSASRVYYSVFQMAINCFVKGQFIEQNEKRNIPHDKMKDQIKLFLQDKHASNNDLQKAFAWYETLRMQRLVADYEDRNVAEDMAKDNIKKAKDIIEILKKYTRNA